MCTAISVLSSFLYGLLCISGNDGVYGVVRYLSRDYEVELNCQKVNKHVCCGAPHNSSVGVAGWLVDVAFSMTASLDIVAVIFH